MGREVPVLAGLVVGAYLAFYLLARGLGVIPLPLIPYLNAIGGLLVIVTIPFILWYAGFPVGLAFIITIISGVVYAFFGALITVLKGEK